jgi:hypothetical protein
MIECIDPSCYSVDFEMLVESGTTVFSDLLHGKGWLYGQEIPDEINGKDFFECIEEYEI